MIWPHDDEQPFVGMTAIEFADQASIDASLGSPDTTGVLADVARFTDIRPVLCRSV